MKREYKSLMVAILLSTLFCVTFSYSEKENISEQPITLKNVAHKMLTLPYAIGTMLAPSLFGYELYYHLKKGKPLFCCHKYLKINTIAGFDVKDTYQRIARKSIPTGIFSLALLGYTASLSYNSIRNENIEH